MKGKGTHEIRSVVAAGGGGWFGVGGVVLGAAALRADDPNGGGSGRAVRLSSVDGQVQVSQGADVLADHALTNTPLFEGTQIRRGTTGERRSSLRTAAWRGFLLTAR